MSTMAPPRVHHDPIVAAPLRVFIREEVTHETTIDVVAYFEGLSEGSREAYRRLHPEDFTNPGEHEWPMEWLMPHDAEYLSNVMLTPHVSGRGVRHDPGHPDVEVGVVRRAGGEYVWTVADFEHLIDRVEWLREFHGDRMSVCGVCGLAIERVSNPRDAVQRWDHHHQNGVVDHEAEPNPYRDPIAAAHSDPAPDDVPLFDERHLR